MAEYNAYTAAATEKNPAAQLKVLDDFVAKYPNSDLLNYVYPLYYKNYAKQKNIPKVIEYADKLIALGDKVTPTERYQAYSARAFAYNNMPNPDAATAKAAYEAALAGVKSVDELPKPEGYDEAKFDDDKKKAVHHFQRHGCQRCLGRERLSRTPSQSYKTVLASNPDDLISNYNLGSAYLA